jgi:hypothetical protein
VDDAPDTDASAAPRAVRVTRLVSRPGQGSELVERCRRIAARERLRYPGAYLVTQGRAPVDGERVEVISITQWIDLDLMQSLIPPGPLAEPAFWSELNDIVESWTVELFEVTWPDPVSR